MGKSGNKFDCFRYSVTCHYATDKDLQSFLISLRATNRVARGHIVEMLAIVANISGGNLASWLKSSDGPIVLGFTSVTLDE